MPNNTPPAKQRIPFDPSLSRVRFVEHGAWAAKHIDGHNFDMFVLAADCSVSYETMAGIRRGFSAITPEIMPVLERAFGEPYHPGTLAEWHRTHAAPTASSATTVAADSNGGSSNLEDKLVELILEVVPMLAASRQLAIRRHSKGR